MITTKQIRKTTKLLDEIIKQYKKDHPEKERDWRTYEEQVQARIKKAFSDLKPLIQEACNSIKIIKANNKGAKEKLSLTQQVLILLLQRFFHKSNRDMSMMLTLFSLLNDVDVSYKTVERIYSKEYVILAIHNLHQLILKKKGIERANCGGDGSGISLTIKKHYASSAQKLKNKLKDSKGKEKKKSKKRVYVYFFALMDIETRMYIGFGTGFKSEQEAFDKANELVKETNVIIESIRLDRYYSAQKYVKEYRKIFGDVKFYLIPKKNATIKGPTAWKNMLKELITDPNNYLQEYFKRNQSESGFSEDKKRTGWLIRQKREDRIETANFCMGLWHNLFWLGS